METYTTVRYRCDHCRKSYARKGAASTHEANCHHNPAVRACTTCKHFKPSERAPHFGSNECAVDGFQTPGDVYAYADDDLVGFEKHCPMWEPTNPRK